MTAVERLLEHFRPVPRGGFVPGYDDDHPLNVSVRYYRPRCMKLMAATQVDSQEEGLAAAQAVSDRLGLPLDVMFSAPLQEERYPTGLTVVSGPRTRVEPRVPA